MVLCDGYGDDSSSSSARRPGRGAVLGCLLMLVLAYRGRKWREVVQFFLGILYFGDKFFICSCSIVQKSCSSCSREREREREQSRSYFRISVSSAGQGKGARPQ